MKKGEILLVDDDPVIRLITKKILEKEGHDISVAEDGKKCMDFLSNNKKPDLILLDVMMHGENGWEIGRKIKSNNKMKDIPLAMFTVRSSIDSRKKSFEYAHADAHIDKPFIMDELIKEVNQLIK